MDTPGPGETVVTTAEVDSAYPVLSKHFTGEERQEMKVEDSLTWKHVVTLLVAVVSMGVLLMIFTVLWVSLIA
ncbi:MAG: hypothetical protein KF708_10850 [Pirellulales bacterium]|nr:hypothetical protein [Pirellulales bacterium]